MAEALPSPPSKLKVLGHATRFEALVPLVNAPTVPQRGFNLHMPHDRQSQNNLRSTFTCQQNYSSSALPEPSRVVILGLSPTSGCGACGGFNSLEAHLNRLVNSSERGDACHKEKVTCVLSHSWGRQFHEELSRRGQLVDTDIWFKNAVSPDFFAHCTRHYIPEDADIVILEIATNLWGSPSDLIRRIRSLAPRADLVIALWPTQDRAAAHQALVLLNSLAVAHGVEVLRVDRMLEDMPLPSFRYYNHAGKDKVHPNALGHALLANATAHYVAERLEAARLPNCRLRNFTAGGAAAQDKVHKVAWERCFPDATMLPVVNSSSWELRDEGGSKGVKKLGYVSEQLNAEMCIGPLPGPGLGRNCEHIRVQLGYHVRQSTPMLSQGALKLRCTGCDCSQVPMDWSSRTMPFPLVQTDAALATERELRRNISVTAITSFDATFRAGERCWLWVRHVAADGAGNASTQSGIGSRVRVDYVSVEEVSLLPHAAIMWKSRSKFRKGFSTFQRVYQCDPGSYRAACAEQSNETSGSSSGTAAIVQQFCDQYGHA